MSKFDPEKLKALQATKASKVGGARVAKPSGSKGSTSEDIKVISAVTKLGGQAIPNVSEVHFFHTNSEVTTFNKPKFLGVMPSNTYAITGKSETKSLIEALSTNQSLISHMGMEGLQQLQKLSGLGMPGAEEETEDAPELVDA